MRNDLAAISSEIRQLTLAMIYHASSGHPGGSLSCADILAYLFGSEMAIRPQQPDWEDRDRFVLSKGHACPALYATGIVVGYPAESVRRLRKLGSAFQGHPHVKALPWVETSTGSLGQGFSVAVGMALGLRYQQRSGRVYVLLGDGELQEGEVWEAMMSAAHFELSNLCAIIDYNKLQSDSTNAEVITLEPLIDKLRAFGWLTHEVNGHDIPAIAAACDAAGSETTRPSIIIAHTIKGKGVSFMENQPKWHGSVKLSKDEIMASLSELGCDRSRIEMLVEGVSV